MNFAGGEMLSEEEIQALLEALSTGDLEVEETKKYCRRRHGMIRMGLALEVKDEMDKSIRDKLIDFFINEGYLVENYGSTINVYTKEEAE